MEANIARTLDRISGRLFIGFDLRLALTSSS